MVTIPVAPRVIALDETKYWNLSSCPHKETVERIDGVYFYDENEVTHCCELTPSYLLQFLYNRVTFIPSIENSNEVGPYDVREAVEYWMQSGADNEDQYMHCSLVNRLAIKVDVVKLKDYAVTEDETRQSVNEEVREYLSGNHVL